MKTKGKGSEQLNVKQKRLVRAIVSGKSQKEAAIIAGYSPRSAETTASRMLRKDKVKKSIQELMARSGLSDERLLEKHRELLNAQKIISVVCGKEGDNATIEYTEVPDYAVQSRALEMAYRLQGAFVPEKIMGVVHETHEERVARLGINLNGLP